MDTTTRRAAVRREAGEMADHFADILRRFNARERAPILAELVDMAERQGRLDARTAFYLRDRAADILQAIGEC
jgi:hypothetical protein